MSLQTILSYVNTPVADNTFTIGQGYGTENFCVFLYSLIKMDQPNVVVELGVGGGVTTCLAAQALRENGVGMLWGIDNGSAWKGNQRSMYQAALGYNDDSEVFVSFLRKLLEKFELESFVTYVDMTVGETGFYAPHGKKIDLLFADAPYTGPEGCINLLRYYLPRMCEYSSIFIDRASTMNHSYLLLKYVVEQLNRQKLPQQIRMGLTLDQEAQVRHLMANCEFSIVHLTDHSRGKRNRRQNSRAWIKIEPCDYLPHNEVISFAVDGKEMRPATGPAIDPGRAHLLGEEPP
jgi:Methyltransferase domain